jgi:YVTN family beta-propeller protein
MSPPSGNLYVTNFDSDSVSRVKMYGAGTPAVTEIPVGKGPGSCVGLQVGYPFENTAWMVIEASSGDATLSLINDSLGIVWETVPVDAGPVLLATNGIGPLDPQTFLLSNLSIVGHQGTGKVSLLLDGTLTPFITLPTGASPWAALIDPDYNALYVANRDANTVTVIDLYKFRVQQQVPVGARPQSLALDLRNVFVANQNGGASGSVSVIKRFNFRPAQDANGDGRSDILAQSAVSGELAMLYMNGVLPSEIQTDLFVKLAPGPWVSVLRGDFSGDRKDDLLLRHSVTKRLGFVYLFPTMAGTLVDAPITRVPLHAVDCLGTEVRCVLVRDSATGEVAYWSGYLGSPKEQVIYDRDPAWTPILVGDLDGDMRDDIVWRHTDGSVAAWLMTGTSTTPYDAIFGSKANKVLLAPGTAWVPEHLGDFDGDGRADILWRNTTTGETAIWLMNGLDAKSYASVHPGTAGWRVTNVRDLDGDQKDDLVWRSAAGETAAWLMDGLAANSGRMSVLLDDPNWRVTHTQFTAVSPRSSLVWRNDVTGETAVWTMNGLMPQSAAYISHDPDWVVVPPE